MAEQTQTTAKELLDRVSAIKSGTAKDVAKERNKATAAGGAMGAMMGLYFGTSRRQNILVCGIIGAVIGAITVRIVMPKND
jgi:uncharacterized membrane protein